MSETEGALGWLQRWYGATCDGDWEHAYGVTIDTLDNPGWSLKVSLAGTTLEGLPFPPVTTDRTESDWVHASVDDGEYRAYGGPSNLVEMIDLFRRSASPVGPRRVRTVEPPS